MDRIEDDALAWAPSRAVFLRRVWIRSAATFAGLAIVGGMVALYAGLPVFWALIAAAAISVGFMAEDLVRWQASRLDLWQVHGTLLIHDGPDGRAQIPLTEIVEVTPQWGSRVVVKLRSGQRLLMRYLRYPAETAAQIEAARGPDHL